MLKLFDAFIIEKFGTNGKRKVSSDDLAAISDLCSVLLKPISSADGLFTYCICLLAKKFLATPLNLMLKVK